MEPTINPYAEPSKANLQDGLAFDSRLESSRNHSMVNQLPILGTLQIVMGCLELMTGGLWVFMAFFMPFAMAQAAKQQPPNPPLPAAFLSILVGYYAVVGVLVLFFAILRIISGIQSFFYRGWMLMMVSLIGGMISIGTIYCAIFSVALAVYGLILMLHPAVKQAYALAKSGQSAKAIREHFASAVMAD